MRPDRRPHGTVWVDQEFVTHPPHGIVQVRDGMWWAVNAEGKVALWRLSAPQANANKAIAERIQAGLEGAVGLVWLERTYIPWED